jgi:hypothetical protein
LGLLTATCMALGGNGTSRLFRVPADSLGPELEADGVSATSGSSVMTETVPASAWPNMRNKVMSDMRFSRVTMMNLSPQESGQVSP